MVFLLKYTPYLSTEINQILFISINECLTNETLAQTISRSVVKFAHQKCSSSGTARIRYKRSIHRNVTLIIETKMEVCLKKTVKCNYKI